VPNTGGAAGDGCGRQVEKGPEREGPCVRCRLWGMQGRTARWQRRWSRQAAEVLQVTAVVGNCRQASMKGVSTRTQASAVWTGQAQCSRRTPPVLLHVAQQHGA